jgi:hypothetical protein
MNVLRFAGSGKGLRPAARFDERGQQVLVAGEVVGVALHSVPEALDGLFELALGGQPYADVVGVGSRDQSYVGWA